MKYAHLSNLIGAYLNQDYSYYADTLEGVIDAYKRDATPVQMQSVQQDIAAFLRAHPTGLDEAFDAAFGADFDPRLWDMTAQSFLRMLAQRLQTP